MGIIATNSRPWAPEPTASPAEELNLANAVLDSARLQAEQHTKTVGLQTEMLLKAFSIHSQQTTVQLTQMNHNLRHQAANEATEHFLVGMNFLNRQDFGRALEQFKKARERYAGHFATLFVLGFCNYVLGRRDWARDALEAALSQTAEDQNQARRQRAWAALYLGRLAFEERRTTRPGPGSSRPTRMSPSSGQRWSKPPPASFLIRPGLTTQPTPRVCSGNSTGCQRIPFIFCGTPLPCCWPSSPRILPARRFAVAPRATFGLAKKIARGSWSCYGISIPAWQGPCCNSWPTNSPGFVRCIQYPPAL